MTKKKLLALTMALVLAVTLPLAVLAEVYDLAQGSITVEAREDGQYVSQEGGVQEEKQTTDTVIKQTDSDTTSTTNTITIKATGEVTNEDGTKEKVTAEVTISDVNIDVSGTGDKWKGISGDAAISAEGDGNVTIELDGDNTAKSGNRHAGVEKNNDGNLTITDADADGALEAAGGFCGAGIGGGGDKSVSNITIEGGDITATGGEVAAGIGGGARGSGSDITIKGDAQVKATGGEAGAGIGSGMGDTSPEPKDVSGSNITIEGNAQVEATGGASGAGIGGGKYSSGSNITIRENAQVSVKGGTSYRLWGKGAGIGDGGNGGNEQGSEVEPNTDGLATGSIAYYAPDADKGKDAPEKLLHKTASGTIESHTNITMSTTPATCTENAATVYQCSCGETIKVEQPGTVLGHDVDSYTYDNNATCMADGTESGTCKRCGQKAYRTKEDTLDPSKHSFTDYVSNGDATCTEDGTKTAVCDYGCGTEDTVPDEGSKLEHKFEPYVPDNNATCTENGTETAKCAYGCGAEDTREIPDSKLPHEFGTYVYQDDATCTADGTEIAQCKHCDATDTRTAEGTMLEHKFGTYVSNNDATCTADGTKTATCTYGCGTEDTVPDEGTMLEHKFDNYVSNNDATCTENGTETAKCAYGCGAEDTRVIPDSKLPHEFGTYVYQDDATCTADGTEIAQCKHCDATDERTAEGTMLEHSFTHYVSNGDATYDSDGTKTAECDYGCGATDTTPDEGSKLTLYRVTDEAGKSVVYKSNYSGSTLTITAEYDHATLTGTVAALRHLQGKGIETIVFITNGATSTFNLADVTEAGVYALTHDAENVAFLLNGEDIGSILK